MTYVNLEACRNDPNYTPNVAMLRDEGVRLIEGRIPRAIRNELMAGVRKGHLGRLAKDGLMPEAFFHPNSQPKAIGLRQQHAKNGLLARAKVLCCMSDLPAQEQAKVLARHGAPETIVIIEDEAPPVRAAIRV